MFIAKKRLEYRAFFRYKQFSSLNLIIRQLNENI